MSTNFSSSLPTKLLTAAIYEKCPQSFLIELKIYVSFNSKKNLRARTKNKKPLTIGTLAPLLLFNVFLLHRSLSQHLKLHFLTIDPCLYLLQMSSLHTDFMVHSF